MSGGEAFSLELRTGGSCSLVEGAIYLVCISPMVRKSRFYWWGRGTQLNASFWDLNTFFVGPHMFWQLKKQNMFPAAPAAPRSAAGHGP